MIIIMKKDFNAIKVVNNNQAAPMGYVLFMAYIGAVIYFFGQSATFWGFILALLKAAVWPAYVMLHVLQVLGA